MTCQVMSLPASSERSKAPGPWDATDPHQFAARFSECYSRLAVIAAGVAGDSSAAEDIVQDAAVIAFQKVAEFRPGSNFAAWLAEIVRRCALNHRRKSKGRRTYATDPSVLVRLDKAAVQPGGGLDYEAVATTRGELAADQTVFDDELVSALNELSEDARCCLLLRTLEHLSYAEISAIMQIPEGTAMSHVHRSRTALREKLTRHAPPPEKTSRFQK
jgi:RNA polymerase sigma-70 factor (ECF subfamily)